MTSDLASAVVPHTPVSVARSERPEEAERLDPREPREPLEPPRRSADLDEARTLADQGRFDEAAERCDVHLRKYGPTAEVCFLLGLVRDAKGHESEAETWYRKALYLDRHHEQALLHLALLLERHARPTEARVLRQRLHRAARF